MAEKVDQLFHRQVELQDDFFSLMPLQYDDPDPRDPIGLAWYGASKALAEATTAVSHLLCLLTAKVKQAERPTADAAILEGK
jgi:hypothetical protein